jgi:membrane protease subunit HflK
VQASLVDADRARNDAEAYERDIIPRARGKAQKIIQAAYGYKGQVIAEAQGLSQRFELILKSYSLNPELTRFKQYFDMIDDIFGKTQMTLFDSKTLGQTLQHLMIDSNKSDKGEKTHDFDQSLNSNLDQKKK